MVRDGKKHADVSYHVLHQCSPVLFPLNKGPRSRESQNKTFSKSKGKWAQSPSSAEDKSHSESDLSKWAHTSKKLKGKQGPIKCTHCSSVDAAVVEIKKMVMLDIEKIEQSLCTGGDECMDGRTDDEDVSITPANRIMVY